MYCIAIRHVLVFFSSENGHVAYQIKENDTYNNMQANNLPLHTNSTPGVGLKGKKIFFLLKVVMLHIELTGRLVILPLHTNSTPEMGSKGDTNFAFKIWSCCKL